MQEENGGSQKWPSAACFKDKTGGKTPAITLLLGHKKNFGKGGYFFIWPGIVLFPGKMRPFRALDGSGIRMGTSNRINLFYKPC